MTQRQAIRFTRLQLLEQFRSSFPELIHVAEYSNLASFKSRIDALASASRNAKASETVLSLLKNDGKTVKELSTGEDIQMGIISGLYSFLKGVDDESDYCADAFLDIYYQLRRLDSRIAYEPEKEMVEEWMDRWPSGLDPAVSKLMFRNKQRIMHHLVEKVSSKSNRSAHYRFEEGMSYEDKYERVGEWWNDCRFHITMAARTPKEINQLLGGTLSKESYAILLAARHKEMPFFLTPYYASLMNTEPDGYDDYAIRSYVLYSPELVHTYGNIKAWEKEDTVKAGEPNAAGWIVPNADNIHRRYPDVAILIPDTMGRSCGGLCASCQRMYGFQNRHLHFDLQELQPKENWPHKLHRLMEYFENDSQIRDILITGGDALMSQNKSLENILFAVCDMAERKRKANRGRANGEKYAEMQRIRLGTRLPVYLPMRINDELVDILRRTKEKGTKAGISQFIIQTHFQSPLELTPMALEGIRKLKSAGWSISNQLVYNVAASRRGHTAKLRKLLQDNGVDCYYTFSVKGFEENRDVFTPNCRSVQEAEEEKIWIRSSDRNVLNLPAIGKSMTFQLAGIMPDGRRVLCFDHDGTRKHSPIIENIGKVYILENKSVASYLRQLDMIGENSDEYSSIWDYTSAETEPRAPIFHYPEYPFTATDAVTNYADK